MQPSRYSFFIKHDAGTVLAFSGLTGAFVEMSTSEYKAYRSLIGKPCAQHARKAKDLCASGLLHDVAIDETAYLRVRSRLVRYQGNIVGMTIAPTLDCNFKCTYCFQRRKPDYMSESIAAATTEYLERRLRSGAKAVSVTWYGGEPFLPRAYHTMTSLSAAFRRLCRKYEASYSFALVSNGSLMNRRMIKQLLRDRCTSLQVTLDGPPDIHDERRPFRDGRGSFGRVMANLQEIKGLLPIRIRVNVDRNNRASCLGLLQHMKRRNLDGTMSVYFAPVESYSHVCKSARAFCFLKRDFSHVQVQLYREALRQGFSVVPFPATTATACGAECFASVLIEPDGYLQKCWNAVGIRSEAVGHLTDQEVDRRLLPNLLMWLNWDVFREPKCVKCKLLPICMGSCLYKKLSNDGQSLECPTWKHNLRSMLLLYYHAWKAARIAK